MNRFNYVQIFIIFLLVIVSVEFCYAEVVIRVFNSKTGKFENFEMTPELRAKYDRQEAERTRQMMENPPSPSSSQNEAISPPPVILLTPSEEGSQQDQPQWQTPTFGNEKRRNRFHPHILYIP